MGDAIDRTMAGDPDNSISPGSPAIHYDARNRPVFAHSTPVARKRSNVDITCAESIIPSSSSVTPSRRLASSIRSDEKKATPQGQFVSPNSIGRFTSPGHALSRFSGQPMLTPVKMIVCTNSKMQQMTTTADFGSFGLSSSKSETRPIFDSRQYLTERNEKKIQRLVSAAAQTRAEEKDVAIQTSILVVEDNKRDEGTVETARLEYSSLEKEFQVQREIEIRMELESWCRRHPVLDRVIPIIFMVLFALAILFIFCPLSILGENLMPIIDGLLKYVV